MRASAWRVSRFALPFLPLGVFGLMLSVDIDDSPSVWTPLLNEVGLSRNATIALDLYTAKPCPHAHIMVLSRKQRVELERNINRDTLRVNSLRVKSSWRASLSRRAKTTFALQAAVADRYYVGILQEVPGSLVGLRGSVAFTNQDGNQLSLQEQALPGMLLALAQLFFCIGAWLCAYSATHRRGLSRLHGLLILTILTKSLVLSLMDSEVTSVARNGQESIVRQICCRFLQEVQALMEVISFYVISLGWKLTRSHLQMCEWALVTSVCAVSLLLSCYEIIRALIMDPGGDSVLVMQFGLHSLCFLVIVVATNFNILTLQRQIAEALAAPETSALYHKHWAFCVFRGLFLYFVVLPPLLNALFVHVVSWQGFWVVVLMREASLFVVYAGISWIFRPGPKHMRVFDLALVESSDSDDSEANSAE